MRDLAGKVALVTGAGSGIGRAIALEFSSWGTMVAANDVDGERASDVVREINSRGGRAFACQGDVSERSSVDQMVARVSEELGALDILVNNAGFGHYTPFQSISEANWDRMIGVHLKGTFNVIQACLPHLKARQNARIINMASVAGLTGTPAHCHYSAAKAGIIGLTKALARELAAHKITVNAVAPGLIETPFMGLVEPKLVDVYLERTPLKRVGKPEEVAWVCLFLASERSEFVTGQVVSPNGGFVI